MIEAKFREFLSEIANPTKILSGYSSKSERYKGGLWKQSSLWEENKLGIE
jgi:hypothetical protein